MRILVLTPTFLPALGGAELVILQVSRRLAERHSVLVLTPYLPDHLLQHSGSKNFDNLINFDVLRYHDRFTLMKLRGHKVAQGLIPPFSISAISAIKHAIAAFHPDIINVHYVMPTGLAGLFAQHMLKIPVVITYNGRDVPGPGVPLFWKYWHRFIGFQCADMTFVSKYCRKAIYGSRASNGHIIYNGVEDPVPVEREQVAELKASLKVDYDAPIIFSLQRLIPLKRIEVLIKSMPIILARQPHLVLIIGGQGADRSRLERLAATMGLSDRVIFVGFIPPEKIPVYFTAAELFVFHSTYETFGMVLAEAMNYGKAIVTVDNTAIREVVTDGETGILVQDSDHQAFAEAVLHLLNDQSLRHNLEKNARQKVRRHFKWDFIAANYEAVFASNILSTAS